MFQYFDRPSSMLDKTKKWSNSSWLCNVAAFLKGRQLRAVRCWGVGCSPHVGTKLGRQHQSELDRLVAFLVSGALAGLSRYLMSAY